MSTPKFTFKPKSEKDVSTIPVVFSVPEITYPEDKEQAATGFTPSLVTEILENIKIGMNLTDSAYLVGLTPKKVNNWFKTNFCNFTEAVNYCQALNKRIHVGRIQTAKEPLKVKAASWFLERKYKEEFSKEVTVVVNHVLIDNVSRICSNLMIKYIKDPEMLRLAAEEFKEIVSRVNANDLPAKVAK